MQRPTIPNKDIPTADPEQLIYCFMPWIRKIAFRYVRCLEKKTAVDLDDLLQVGQIALLNAQKVYDPDGGANFLTFTFNPIRTAMRHELGFTADGQLQADPVSLDKTLSDDGDETWKDFIPDTAPTAEEQRIEQDIHDEISEAVHSAVEQLKSNQQREIIGRVYFADQPRKQAAADMGVTHSRGCAIEHEALRKLRMDRRLQQLSGYRRISLTAFRYLWSSEEEDFIIRQEKAYDSIYGDGAYAASFRHDL